MTGFIEPLDGLRDVVTWPVLPVTPSLPVRKIQDLEPFSPPVLASCGDQAEVRDSVDLSGSPAQALVAELMQEQVVTIGPDQSITELEDLLVQHGISGVPVTENGVLLGVVSQTDLVQHHLGLDKKADRLQVDFHYGLLLDSSRTHGGDKLTSSVRVCDIMTPHSFYATENATIQEVLELMLQNHIHRVVITRDRHLVGVVTSFDILHYFHRTMVAQQRRVGG